MKKGNGVCQCLSRCDLEILFLKYVIFCRFIFGYKFWENINDDTTPRLALSFMRLSRKRARGKMRSANSEKHLYWWSGRKRWFTQSKCYFSHFFYIDSKSSNTLLLLLLVGVVYFSVKESLLICTNICVWITHSSRNKNEIDQPFYIYLFNFIVIL